VSLRGVCCFVINFVATAAVVAAGAATARLFVLIMEFSLPTTQSLQDTYQLGAEAQPQTNTRDIMNGFEMFEFKSFQFLMKKVIKK
jgi:hypothetical protein